SSRRRHPRFSRDWSSDVCSSDLDIVARECSAALVQGSVVPMGAREKRRVLETAERWAGQALRVLALAYRPLKEAEAEAIENGEKIGRASCRERVQGEGVEAELGI